METPLMEELLGALLSLTHQLERKIVIDQAKPEVWNELLEQRQSIIDELSLLQEQGLKFTDQQKQTYLVAVYAIDQRLIPLILKQKEETETSLKNVRKSKIANQQYNGYGNAYNPYGAFFDKKK